MTGRRCRRVPEARGQEWELPITQIDGERNYQLKLEMEGYLRRLEGDTRIRRGTTERLIKKVIG